MVRMTSHYFSSSFPCIDLTFLAQSTTQIFGTSPSLAAPALQSRRVREQILRKEKKRAYPCGLGIEGTSCLKCVSDSKNETKLVY